MIKVAVIGATGYTGVELLRLLVSHPEAELCVVCSRSAAGSRVADYFPSLRGYIDLEFVTPDSILVKECDVVFFATPNAVAMHQAQVLLQAGCKVIDLSADFRLKDAEEWAQWYGEKHACPDLLAQSVYGLPELNREKLKDADLVANPGCYPTAIQLGFLPLIENQLVRPESLIADAKSGVSGAGRKANMASQFCETADSFKAYSVDGHRHLPEIKQSLQTLSTEKLELVFVPHLTPMIRGIHATLYATLKDTSVDLQSLYSERYKDESFVDVMPEGVTPDTSSVRGSNHCRLACFRPQQGNTVIVLAVEDNLVKGAAGQAIQNMNIMFRLNETTGLSAAAIYP
ncbi:MAG: N-acetyl-gamma-glutamyl-phosphate reductase [Gammaproteobacteria bacterium]|nr:N-acetyl-gamma-glutamyl-phosphate reductase [Gammaproteobacteria bacterium]